MTDRPNDNELDQLVDDLDEIALSADRLAVSARRLATKMRTDNVVPLRPDRVVW
jgi:hypothetical protein